MTTTPTMRPRPLTRLLWPLLATSTVLAAAACGVDTPGTVGEAATPGTYDGPLYVSSEGLEKSDPIRKTGAAGQVVQCDSKVSGGFNDGVYDNGAAASDPTGALATARGEGGFDGAQKGYLIAREESQRVLFTYDVDGVPKEAIIVRDGPTIDGDGWYIESWARCDLSEFPRAVTDETGTQVWTDRDGKPVEIATIASYVGPEHCGWQASTFLYLDDAQYVRQPPKDLPDGYFDDPYRADVPLPKAAVDTGYSRDGKNLWLSPDHTRAYVGTENSVELWPRATPPIGCD
jgi:hypothetical protein